MGSFQLSGCEEDHSNPKHRLKNIKQHSVGTEDTGAGLSKFPRDFFSSF